MRKTLSIRVSALLAATLVAGLLVVPTSTAAACGSETVTIRGYHVDLKTSKKTYERGESARLEITVTRPAHEDPAGQGIEYEPPVSEPAEGVDVGIGMFVGDVFHFGYGKTDADGKTNVKIRIAPYAKPGWAYVRAYAETRHANIASCITIVENGYTESPRAFKATR